MHTKNILKSMKYSIFLATSLVVMSSSAYAVDLAAVERTWTPSTGAPVTMWGFIEDTTGDCSTLPVNNWLPGPDVTIDDLVGQAVGGALTINLLNCLTTQPVSIMIPGQTQDYVTGPVFEPDASGRDRITSFTHVAEPNGGTATYTWPAVAAGVYLYQSGSYVATQVHMGLYGVLRVGEYVGTSGEVTLLYSEIDPKLHDPVAAATPLNYKPSYFLLNGEEQPAPIKAGDVSNPIALNFLNAGLDFHVPAIDGEYLTISAEDGNPYPHQKEQVSVNLAAGKTMEAFWDADTAGEYKLFDRRGHGMVTRLLVYDDVAEPLAVDDVFGVANVGTDLSVAVAGVLANDYEAGAATVSLVSGPSAGGSVACDVTSGVICADGSFTYTPPAIGVTGQNFADQDTFVYQIDGSTSQGSVSIDVNSGPDAADDSMYVWRKSKANKRDAGDPKGTNRNRIDLTYNDMDTTTIDPASIVINLPPKGKSKVKFRTAKNGIVRNWGNGFITYDPKNSYVGMDSFTYTVMDMQGAVSNEATVTIEVYNKRQQLQADHPNPNYNNN